MEIEVYSSSEPETELGVATWATAPSLLDRLRCLTQSELSRKRKTVNFCFQNALSCQHYAKLLALSRTRYKNCARFTWEIGGKMRDLSKAQG